MEVPLANFFASGVLELGPKPGPILWQFPPSFKFELERVENFFRILPRNMEAAVELAQHHDRKTKDAVAVGIVTNGSVRHAMEVRHPSFGTEEFIALLRKYEVAIVVADTAGKWALIEDFTSDFVYIRLHGDEELYASAYSSEAVDMWAKKSSAGYLAAPHSVRNASRPRHRHVRKVGQSMCILTTISKSTHHSTQYR